MINSKSVHECSKPFEPFPLHWIETAADELCLYNHEVYFICTVLTVKQGKFLTQLKCQFYAFTSHYAIDVEFTI